MRPAGLINDSGGHDPDNHQQPNLSTKSEQEGDVVRRARP